MILDDFSRLAFGYEWTQVLLQKDTWREQVHHDPIDLLFVESAWHGNADSWQYCLTGPSSPAANLISLVQWCKENEVPTVFWNKEDPIHFDDFIDTAKLFDHVFTTDSNQIENYKTALGHDRVGVMPFAAQELIHNPVRPKTGFQSRDVAFGGMYFAHRHAERRQQMDLLLGAALDVSPRMNTGLEIFSRYLGEDERYQFPGELAKRVVGSLNYEEMLTAYRTYKAFLNVNTVIDSPTMCARRIFEITASGTPVVTTPSEAIGNFFDDSMVTQVEDPDHAKDVLRALVNSEELRSAQTHRAQRTIWEKHTYNHRINEIMTQVGLTDYVVPTKASVSMLASTNRPHQLEHIIRMASQQQGVDAELLLLTHGFEPDHIALRNLARSVGLENLVILHADESVPLGQCLNILADAASGEFSAKFDDDDNYGPHYLADQAHAMGYSQADVVGKEAHYIHLAGHELTTLHSPYREHQFTDFIPGPTIFSRTSTIQEVQFPPLPRGEDSGFLQRIQADRGKIYSADRFQFVRYRASSGHAHTWSVSDWHILANSRVEYFGSDPTPAMK